MIDIRQILRLGRVKVSKSKTSTIAGVSRKTLSRCLVLAGSAGINYSGISNMSNDELFNLFHKQICPLKIAMPTLQIIFMYLG